MSFWLPLVSTVNSIKGGGVYRIWYKDVSNFQTFPDITEPTDYPIPGSTAVLRVLKTEKFPQEKKFSATVTLIGDVPEEGVSTSGLAALPHYQANETGGQLTRVPTAVPIVGIVIAVLALIGVGLANATFDKIEKLIDNPVIEAAVVVGLIVAVFFLVVAIRKHSS